MPVDRMTFKVPFNKDSHPQWTCPTCNKGILKKKEETFFCIETKESLQSHGDENWEPDWIEYRYTCQFVCINPTCEEMVFNIGSGQISEDYDYDELGNLIPAYITFYQPKFFFPHLHIFPMVKNTPKDIKESINESFKLFFTSPSSSANHLRIALEKLLDYLKINKYEVKGGKRNPISTYKRINSLPTKFSIFKDRLIAIKWLGNSGSHSQNISIDDVMDAYDIFETVLEEIFDNKIEKIAKLAKKINKAKGPQANKKTGR